jgi:hypothetical protein
MRMIKQICEDYHVSEVTVARLRPRVRSLLLRHWSKVERVATASLKARTLSGSEIDALFANCAHRRASD